MHGNPPFAMLLRATQQLLFEVIVRGQLSGYLFDRLSSGRDDFNCRRNTSLNAELHTHYNQA